LRSWCISDFGSEPPIVTEIDCRILQKLRQFDKAMIGELLEQADKDPDPAVRRVILDRLGRLRVPQVRDSLERGTPPATRTQVWRCWRWSCCAYNKRRSWAGSSRNG
jgi:hypothetical protein